MFSRKYFNLLLVMLMAAFVTEAAAKGWVQSYKSGYTDKNGNYCGGSEIMHIVPHKGKLYAFNGFWKDKNLGKYSAQVLRLDEPDGQWVADLTTSQEGLKYKAGSIIHMKGNILKSVLFKTDKNGKEINEKILIAAAWAWNCDKNRNHGISFFQRNDESGSWKHEILYSGPLYKHYPDGKSKRIRRVPRDIEVYNDPITKIDRIFMLGGNFGVLSGVYNADTKKIEWGSKPEYPKNGKMLDIRPLGMAKANGKLYFSSGGQLFERINGKTPLWKQALNMGGRINTELGGIRGLSTVKNPTGPGESLMFLWIPRGKARGDIKRLDGPKLKMIHETDLRRYFNAYFKNEKISSVGILGGYNRFLSIKDPVSGQIVQLVGFQQAIDTNNKSLVHHNYYKGGTYCVRWSDKKYTMHCINGKWSKGKPILVAPRAYAQSPFPSEKGTIYFGGYDSNFEEATNMAWIFKADLETVLRGK